MDENNLDIEASSQVLDGKPIGGFWLSLIGISLVFSIPLYVINLFSTLTASGFIEELPNYFSSQDALLKLKMQIMFFSAIENIIAIGLLIWVFILFMKRKKKFISVFGLTVLYGIVTKVITIWGLQEYANDAGLDIPSSFANDLSRTIIVGTIMIFYLNKAKRPQETFVK